MEDKQRAKAVQEYLLKILEDKIKDLNINFLESGVDSYSIARLPVAPVVEKWVIPVSVNQEVYNFESRRLYSNDEVTNLSILGFFESFERTILENNKKGILPEIPNVESITCLDCGALLSNNVNTAVFSIQIQINYREEN